MSSVNQDPFLVLRKRESLIPKCTKCNFALRKIYQKTVGTYSKFYHLPGLLFCADCKTYFATSKTKIIVSK